MTKRHQEELKELCEKKESFKYITGFKKEYAISNFGRVYSFRTHRVLKPYIRKDYFCVKLCKKGKAKNYRISILVAKSFKRKRKDKQIVHHKNLDKLDNRADNLQWVTYSEHYLLHHKKKTTCKSK